METEEYRRTVGDYVTLVRGITYKGTLVGKPGPALLGLGSIEPGGGFREGHYKTYGGDCPANLMLFPGDLYVALKGATKDGKMIGSVARVPRTVSSGRLTQDTVKLEFRNPDPEEVAYLYWILRTPQYRTYCANRATGSAVVALSRHDFLTHPVPPLTSTRKQLVDLFEVLDDKIELNREMNQTLEAMAQAIFKSWFVDFDPVRAKMEGRQPAGMDAATAELFPDEFEESALGMIPGGWQIEKVGSIAEAIDYVANGSFALLRENVQYLYKPDFAILVRLADYNAGWNGDFVYITEDAYNFLKKSSLKVDDVVIANVGANAGTVFRVPELGKPMTLGPNAIAVKPKAQVANMSKQYLYYYFSSPEGQNQLQSIRSGSAQPKFNKTDFRSLTLVVPQQEVVFSFSKLIESVWQRQALNNQESRTLASIRDTLLPKLLSGEIRVKEAEKIAAKAM